MKIFNSNNLKIIAIVSMLIDHFALYNNLYIPNNLYIACRIIGRIAMPIFCFLIVQGYFNTSNLKKYILRLFLLAVVTQLGFIMLDIINIRYIGNTSILFLKLNLIFSFAISIILIYLIKNICCGINNKNVSIYKILLQFLTVILILMLYKLIKFEYDIWVPVIILGIYGLQMLSNIIKNKLIYIILLIVVIVVPATINSYLGIYTVLSIPIILLYNGKLGKKNKLLRNLFYIIYPMQHFMYYVISLYVFSNS